MIICGLALALWDGFCMVVALLILAVGIGSVLFHVLSPWWWTPIASNWSYIDHTIIITFWITGVVFVAIILFMAYCIWKFRGDTPVEYQPENKKLEGWLTVVTGVGVAAMLTPGLIVWHDFVTVPKDAQEFEVVGQQWLWNYRLPGSDGVLGTSDTKNVDGDNVLGLNKNDPKAHDDLVVSGADLHIPVNKPVKVTLRSIDVLHDFYVPEFRGKMDMVPGMVTYFWFTPTRTGTFEILCAELCGVGHYTMRGKIVVDNETDYQTWLQGQKTFAQSMAEAEERKAGKTKLATTEPELGKPAELPSTQR
jgi:cytochrome c oxidase subunit 2